MTDIQITLKNSLFLHYLDYQTLPNKLLESFT